MGTSVIIEQKNLPEYKIEKDHIVVTDFQETGKKKIHFNGVKRKVYSHIMESAKSTLLIFAILSIFKITGLYDWWIYLVSRLI